ILIPIKNEDPARVMAGLEVMYQSLRAARCLEHFDFWVLSDTTDADVWIDEEMAFAELRSRLADEKHLKYRKRRHNRERKAGNIGEFCAAHGSRYDFMIVLDADSVMTGESMVALVQLMQTHPEAGIIQAPPMPVNRKTLFGRLQQFAARAYGSVHLTGFAYWQHGESNYFGHNAIIRIAPFQEHCRLPQLPGPEPLGGSILSHDFVEAALMRRAGYRVYLARDLGGSYEEAPPNLIAYAARDRRWCQGNLQHVRLLATPGLHPISRIHLLAGIMAYVSSPLWMLLLILATSDAVLQELRGHVYFRPGPQLFPIWKLSDPMQALMLYTTVIGMMLLPKLLGAAIWLREHRRVPQFGGVRKFLASVVIESLAAAARAQPGGAADALRGEHLARPLGVLGRTGARRFEHRLVGSGAPPWHHDADRRGMGVIVVTQASEIFGGCRRSSPGSCCRS
ncbi:MAG: glucans biosynthesis glucosyltransferase MdoH, partial [Planctomycetota bacterium]